MKKTYQKRLDGMKEKPYEPLPEIEELDQILELPQPLREVALVKAICDTYKKSKKNKNSESKLEAWSEAIGKLSDSNKN